MNNQPPSQDDSSIRVVDSHTEGEPTRVIISGGPELRGSTFSQRWQELQHDHNDFRKTVILEPRGIEATVGVLLCEPDSDECAAGLMFFNNKGYLDMCGHGTIGVAATLAYLDRLPMGISKLQTPAGVIEINLLSQNEVAITNVSSYLLHANVSIDVAGYGELVGDIAYGGNWFFMVQPPVELTPANGQQLLTLAGEIKAKLVQMSFPGVDTALIDHIHFYAPDFASRRSKNFVVCPGGEFDRSPCGTGTSALLACLAWRKQLAVGEVWQQTSLTGGEFSGTYQIDETETDVSSTGRRVIPTITGRSYICSEANLIQHPQDPYRFGNEIDWGQA